MATMMKSLFQHWLKGQSALNQKETEVPQCGGLQNNVDDPDHSAFEDGDTQNTASPWVHGLL